VKRIEKEDLIQIFPVDMGRKRETARERESAV
jgi:hypothetical protein